MLELGDQLGDFQIRRLLGRGGMGEVYEAYEPALQRCVALKLLPEWLSQEAGALQRFQQEAATAARLEHPQIVPIYAWGQADNRFFFTMKLIQGLPLSAFIRRRLFRERLPLCTTRDAQEEISTPAAPGSTNHDQSDATVTNDQAANDDEAVHADEVADGGAVTQLAGQPTVLSPRQATGAAGDGNFLAELNEVFEEYWQDRYAFTARIGEQLARALAYAHAMGQIHRDLKPSNVMIDRHGQVYLIDFGLTRAMTTEATRHRCGTLRYMSPEQLDLRTLDGRTDVYALGVTLYETLSPEPPFEGRDEADIAQQIREGAVLPLDLATPEIPPRLCRCICRAMHPRPEARFATAEESAEEFAACRRECGEAAQPSAPTRQRYPLLLAALACLALLAVAAAMWYAGAGPLASIFSPHRDYDGGNSLQVHFSRPSDAREPPGVAYIDNSIGMRLALVPPGSFWMGAPEGELEANALEWPQHRVHISKEFFLGAYEVTKREYALVMEMNPSHYTAEKLGVEDSGDYPVDSVSWDDAREFCQKLTALPAERRAGRRYRLPTEAEWEYACRAGTTAAFHYGTDLSSDRANVNGKQPYGLAPAGINRLRPTPVGSFAPNAFGLFDMHGNLMEWCQDRWSEYPSPEKEQYDPLVEGKPTENRVARGGSFGAPAADSRSARRDPFPPTTHSPNCGFRVACDKIKD